MRADAGASRPNKLNRLSLPVPQKVKARRVTLQLIGIFEVPITCPAQTDEWIFQASFQKELAKTSLLRSRTPPLPVEEDLVAPFVVTTAPHLREILLSNLSNQLDELLTRNAEARAKAQLLTRETDHLTTPLEEKEPPPNYERSPFELVGADMM